MLCSFYCADLNEYVMRCRDFYGHKGRFSMACPCRMEPDALNMLVVTIQSLRKQKFLVTKLLSSLG